MTTPTLPGRAARISATLGLAGLLLLAGACGKPAADAGSQGTGDQPDNVSSEGLSGSRSENPSTGTGSGKATTSNPTNRPSTATTTRPAGPRIEYFKVVQQPSCPNPEAPAFPGGSPVKLAWKISGGADAGALSVDDPDRTGSYGTYDAKSGEVVVELSFPCDAKPNTVTTHRYTLRTVGGGAVDRKDLTVTAKTY